MASPSQCREFRLRGRLQSHETSKMCSRRSALGTPASFILDLDAPLIALKTDLIRMWPPAGEAFMALLISSGEHAAHPARFAQARDRCPRGCRRNAPHGARQHLRIDVEIGKHAGRIMRRQLECDAARLGARQEQQLRRSLR